MFEKHAGGIIGNLDTSEGSKFRAQFKQALVAFKLKNRSGGTQSFLSGTNFSQHFRDENLRKKMTKACKLLRLKRNKITTKAGFEDEIGDAIIQALSGINVPLLERDLKAYSDNSIKEYTPNAVHNFVIHPLQDSLVSLDSLKLNIVAVCKGDAAEVMENKNKMLLEDFTLMIYFY